MTRDPILAYVLFVDIVGYSKELTPTQAEMVQVLNALTRQCETYRRLRKRRKVVAAPSGDGYALAFFDEIGAPLRCAHELAPLVAQAGKFSLRMAAHVGPVEIKDDIGEDKNVFGEGVNVASRALGFSNPGELVVTQRMYELARELPEFEGRFDPVGEETTKHGLEINLYRVMGPSSADHVPSKDLARAERIHAKALKRGTLSLAPVPMIARRLGRIRRDVVVGLTLFFAMELIHFGVERFSLADTIKYWGYEQLQSFMSEPSSRLPVVIVDLGKGFEKSSDPSRTDPKALAELLAVIRNNSTEKAYPYGIGLDILFDQVRVPEHQETDPDGKLVSVPDSLSPVDPDGFVLSEIQLLSKKTPPTMVYVGVEDPSTTAPEQVFSLEDKTTNAEAAAHVAHLWAPRGDSKQRRVLWGNIEFSPSGESDPSNERIGSLAGKVCEAAEKIYKKRRLNPYVFGEVTLSPIWPSPDGKLTLIGEQFLLNYGALDTLLNETIQLESPKMTPEQQENFARKIAGRVVFIGNASDTADVHTAPGHGEVAGVYFHGVAAYTRLVAPIYSFNLLPGMLVGASTSLIVLLAGGMLRRSLVAAPSEVSDERLRGFLAVALAGLVCLLAVVMLRTFGILWMEFPLVVLSMLLDPLFEPKVHHFGESIGRWAHRALRRRVYEHGES